VSVAVAQTGARDSDVLESLLQGRKSIRAFRPDPVPQALLDRALAMARWAPSNCNTQPWLVHLVSGAATEALRAALVEDFVAGRVEHDIPYLMEQYPEDLRDRQVAHIVCQQTAFGIARDDIGARRTLGMNMMRFFGAPHVALLFMPAFGNEREAADLGGFAQSLMLACAALGLGSCPQTSLGTMSGTIRRVLGITAPVKMLFGIAIGYEDRSDPVARLEQDRLPLDAFVRRHS
jgi:nitroreductase